MFPLLSVVTERSVYTFLSIGIGYKNFIVYEAFIYVIGCCEIIISVCFPFLNFKK